MFYLYWTKVKTLHVNCSQSIYKGNKNVIQQMIYIQVKWLDYASNQMGSGCSQRRRQERHSNVIGVQFLLSTFWTHNLPCFSHQKSVRRTPNSVILLEPVVWTSQNHKLQRVYHMIFSKTNVEIWIVIKFQTWNCYQLGKTKLDFIALGEHFCPQINRDHAFKRFISLIKRRILKVWNFLYYV